MRAETWEEMHLNATDGVLVQKSVKVIRINFKIHCLRHKSCVDSSHKEASASLKKKLKISQSLKRLTRVGKGSMDGWGLEDQCFSGIQS